VTPLSPSERKIYAALQSGPSPVSIESLQALATRPGKKTASVELVRTLVYRIRRKRPEATIRAWSGGMGYALDLPMEPGPCDVCEARQGVVRMCATCCRAFNLGYRARNAVSAADGRLHQ
jgi:hypothetical protein